MLNHHDFRHKPLPTSPLAYRALREVTHVFSLQEVMAHNPKLREVLTARPEDNAVIIGTGVLLASLFEDDLHQQPMMLFQSSDIDEEWIEHFPASGPEFFIGVTELSDNLYLGWYDDLICVDVSDINDLLQDCRDGGRIIVACVAGDSVAILIWYIDDEFSDELYAAHKAMDLRRYRPKLSNLEQDDGIAWENGLARFCIAPDGARSRIMQVVHVSGNS